MTDGAEPVNFDTVGKSDPMAGLIEARIKEGTLGGGPPTEMKQRPAPDNGGRGGRKKGGGKGAGGRGKRPRPAPGVPVS